MKMVKSLLLGSAAGFVAVAGAQAADLPVKAKPVEYVKICSLYGAGFYYIPGTDMCLKIGGWVRMEASDPYNGSMGTGPFSGDVNARVTNNLTWRSRGYITADARNQTEYGTVRSYIALGLNGNDNANTSGAASIEEPLFSSNRAFIQWAGFTAGLATSFYDFYSGPATAYFGTYAGSDTGDTGWKTLGYTAQFGNGFSGTIAVEPERRTQIINIGSIDNNTNGSGNTTGAQTATLTAGTIAPGIGLAGSPIVSAAVASLSGTGTGVASGGAGAYAGTNVPDIIGNLRLDQAWGSAQIMGAAHLVRANYYTSNVGQTATNGPGNEAFVGEATGGPPDRWGYALGAGIKLLFPAMGKGDYFQGMVSFTEGASRYNFQNPNFNHGLVKGNAIAWGVMTDAVYATGSPTMELTQTLAVNAAYEHFWANPAWRTSVYGGYSQVNYSTQANNMLCLAEHFGASPAGSTGAGAQAVAGPGCDNDWQTWWIGTRTQWNVTKDFYIGVDVLYQKLMTATTGDQFNRSPYGLAWAGKGFVAGGTQNSTILVNSDEDNIGVRLRIHRDFYP